MNRRTTLLLPAAALYAFIVTPIAFGTDTVVSGSWTVNLKSQYRTRDTTMRLEQNGTDITGHVTDSSGTQVPLTGTINGNSIVFSYALTGIQVNGIAQPMLKFSGTVDDGKIIRAKSDQPVIGVIILEGKKKE